VLEVLAADPDRRLARTVQLTPARLERPDRRQGCQRLLPPDLIREYAWDPHPAAWLETARAFAALAERDREAVLHERNGHPMAGRLFSAARVIERVRAERGCNGRS
jgi:hypothetical protein